MVIVLNQCFPNFFCIAPPRQQTKSDRPICIFMFKKIDRLIKFYLITSPPLFFALHFRKGSENRAFFLLFSKNSRYVTVRSASKVATPQILLAPPNRLFCSQRPLERRERPPPTLGTTVLN